MAPDKFQQAWRAASSQITIDVDLLTQEVQHSHRTFRSTIFRRDLIEVGVALLMIPIWILARFWLPLPWTWYLTIPVLIWMAGFILVDRIRYPQLPVVPGDTLVISVQKSLAQLEHQIWLLRNVFWWYLLPPTISIMAFFLHVSWLSSQHWWEFLGLSLFWSLLLGGTYGLIYFVNQRAVRTELEPRRRQLEELLSGLLDETSREPNVES